MADNGNALVMDVELEADTPVPAAEVLIDLKESAKRRKALGYSKPATMSNMGLPGASESTDEEEDVFPSQRRFRPEAMSLGEDARERQKIQAHSTLHSVSRRLRNLLKLPKAHKWCYYEWFYPNVDSPIFEGDNDFCRCLADMFPNLKTRTLNRVQWRQVRRLMGKPRRCSPLFFQEERVLMEVKRTKIRLIQQQVHQGVIKIPDFATFKDLPDEIPSLLVVGTPVTAHLHTETHKGFYTGRVEAVDLESHLYWVTFDRPGLGKHLIPDTEVRSARPPEWISLSTLEASQKTLWPPADLYLRHLGMAHSSPPRPLFSHALVSLDSSDPLLTSSPASRKRFPMASTNSSDLPDHVGGFPVDFLKQVTQLSKLLAFKQQALHRLSILNTDAEKRHARQRALSTEFQREYACTILDLDDINKQLNSRLEDIKAHCVKLGYGDEVDHTSLELKDCQEHALKITHGANASLLPSGSEVRDYRSCELIAQLTSLLLMVEVLSESGDSLQVGCLTSAMEEVQSALHPTNRRCFRDGVETPLTMIQSGLNPLVPLHAFSVTQPPYSTPAPDL